MKKFIIFFFLLTACSKNDSNEFSALWTIKEVDLDSNTSTVHFEIENNSNIQLNNGNWSLHWNQLGGAIINSSLPNGIVSKRVNGEYYIMNFLIYFLDVVTEEEFVNMASKLKMLI